MNNDYNFTLEMLVFKDNFEVGNEYFDKHINKWFIIQMYRSTLWCTKEYRIYVEQNGVGDIKFVTKKKIFKRMKPFKFIENFIPIY